MFWKTGPYPVLQELAKLWKDGCNSCTGLDVMESHLTTDRHIHVTLPIFLLLLPLLLFLLLFPPPPSPV